MTKRDVGGEVRRGFMGDLRGPGFGLGLALLAFFGALGEYGAQAQPNALDRKAGTVTGFPIPRFVSLKADEVNVRVGPGYDYPIAWVFRRAGLSVEIISEFDTWRQIRDSEGATGWVSASLLSGRRSAIVAPWSNAGTLIDLKDDDERSAKDVARLERGSIVDIVTCDGEWCAVYAGRIRGFIEQANLWGVYPKEVLR
jgi:SH3-like domain-containing protein